MRPGPAFVRQPRRFIPPKVRELCAAPEQEAGAAAWWAVSAEVLVRSGLLPACPPRCSPSSCPTFVPLLSLFLLLWPGLDLGGCQEHSEHLPRKMPSLETVSRPGGESKGDARPREPSTEALLPRPRGRLPFHAGTDSPGDVFWEAGGGSRGSSALKAAAEPVRAPAASSSTGYNGSAPPVTGPTQRNMSQESKVTAPEGQCRPQPVLAAAGGAREGSPLSWQGWA